MNSQGNSGSKILLTCAGIGCGVFLLIALFIFSAFNGGGGGIFVGVLALLLIVGVVVGARTSNNNANNISSFDASTNFEMSETNPYASKAKQVQARSAEANQAPSQNSVSGEYFDNPVCSHRFTLNQLYSSDQVTCDCENTFDSLDLLELAKLNENLAVTKAAILELRREISSKAKKTTTSVKTSASVAAQTYVAQPAAVATKPKVSRPKPVRPKINLSLQQWLIIGASVLVLVAGSVFVTTNMGRLPQWAFELVTVGVALVTGFGAFKSRNISILLSNFLAAFSSSMQLATMSIIGDQLSPDFEWNTMPAWWWAVSLTVVSIAASVLARFSRNFGFKGIALLGSVGAFEVLMIGVLRNQISDNFAPTFLAVGSLAAGLVLAQNKFLRSIEQPKIEDKAAKAYLGELAKREDQSLSILGMVAAGLQLLVGIGLTLTGVVANPTEALSWASLLSLGLVWALLIATSRFWLDQVKIQGIAAAQIMTVATGIVFSSVAAAISFEAARVNVNLANAVNGSAGVVPAVASIAALFAFSWLSPRFKSFSPNRVSVIVALWLSAAIWVLWSKIDLLQSNQAWITGIYAILFAALLSATDLRFKVNRYDWGSLFVNGVGVSIITIYVVNNSQMSVNSIAFALVSLVLVIATAIQLPLRSYINEKQNFHSAPMTKWVAFFFGALTSLILLVETSFNGSGVAVAFAMAFIALSIASQVLALWGPLATTYETYLLAKHYLGQAIVVLTVVFSISTYGSTYASTNSLVIAALAIVNYSFGTFLKQALKMQLGFASAILSFLAWQWSTGNADFTTSLLIQIAVISAAVWLHTWFLRKRTNSDEQTLLLTPVVSIAVASTFGWAVLGQLTYSLNWQQLFSVNLIYSMFGLAAIFGSRFGSVSKLQTRSKALSWVAIEFAVFSLLSNLIQASDSSADVASGIQWRWLVSLLALSIIIRAKNRKSENESFTLVFYVVNFVLAYVVGDITTSQFNLHDIPEARSVWLAAALVLSTTLSKMRLDSLRRFLLIDGPVLLTALWSLTYALTSQPTDDVNIWRGILSLATIAAFAYFRSTNSEVAAWLPLGYVSGLGSSIWLAYGIDNWLNIHFEGPEIYSVLATASIAIGNVFLIKRFGDLYSNLRLSITVAAFTLPSLVYALCSRTNIDANIWRGILSLAVIAVFAYRRSAKAMAIAWLVVGYLSGLGASIWLGYGIDRWLNINFEGPEIYSVLATASFVVGNWFLVKRLGKKYADLRLIATVGALILPSLVYALGNDSQSLTNELRAVIALSIASALAIARVPRSRALPWSIATYVTLVASSLAVARLLSDQIFVKFNGPEIYSVLATAAIVASHRVGLKHFNFKTTLFRWGLPAATILFPSTFFTYASLNIPFNQLTAAELSRIVLVLIASAALLVHGSRVGNLATSTIGLAGLALLVVPNTAMHSDSVVAGSRIDSTSIAIALLVFGTLALLRRYTSISGNSLLFIGLPVAIALAPALVQSLAALGNPSLTSVDWWRFGIVLASGMTLLIVGTLREVAGLFYPGLLAVLLSALPYGFKQTEHNQWSLWVLLLLVAGVMVWLAVRLERLKRAGRNSASWLRELK